MKKLTLSLVAAGLTTASLGAFAALPTGAAPFQVVVPNLCPGVEFTLEGTYLQPNASNLDYGLTGTGVQTGRYPTLTALTTDTSVVKPKYNLGFGVGIGYVFADSGNDVQVHWQHFSHDTNDSVQDAFAEPTLLLPIVSTNDVLTQNGSVDFRHDAVDLDVGQYISVGTRLQTRLFGGLRYVSLKEDMTRSGTLVSTSTGGPSAQVGGTRIDTTNYSFTQNSKFTGVGPRLGLETNYNVGGNFGVSGMLAGSLLYGTTEATASGALADFYSCNGGPVKTGDSTTIAPSTEKQNRVVPALDAKLGLNYSFGMTATSNATIEAGYKVTEYIGAIDRASLVGFGNTEKNVSLSGPYLSLNVKL